MARKSIDPRIPNVEIERKTIRDQIFEAFKTQIETAVWQPHSKIPSENELARSLGVSRLVIREVIQQFIGLGLLETRQGDGTYLKEVSAKTYVERLIPLLLLERTNLLDLMEYRGIMETGLVPLIVDRVPSRSITKLTQTASKIASPKETIEKLSQDELEFHDRLAAASGNTVVMRFSEIAKDLFESVNVRIMSQIGIDTVRAFCEGLSESLRAKDAEGAQRQIMQYHKVVIAAMHNLDPDVGDRHFSARRST